METPAPGGNRERAAVVDTRSEYTAALLEEPARPTFVLRLEPLPGIDGHKALREALKRLRRNHGLVCRACHEEGGR
jgi:hypothetical protein